LISFGLDLYKKHHQVCKHLFDFWTVYYAYWI